MIARFRGLNGTEIRFVLADLAPPCCGFSAAQAIVIKPFSGPVLFRPDFAPVPAVLAAALSSEWRFFAAQFGDVLQALAQDRFRQP
jgi:hypothetical protein